MKKKVLAVILMVCMGFSLCACSKETPTQNKAEKETSEEVSIASNNDSISAESNSAENGDSMGGRPEYTIEQINNGDLGDTITFNSISDSTIGHEFNFVTARENTGINAGIDNIWSNTISVEDGKTYIVRMYVHNNNPGGINAIAKNVHAMISVPGDTAKEIQVNGFISADNGTPNEYWDEVNFKSDQPFHLEYVTGSARLFNNGAGDVPSDDQRGATISDNVVLNVDGVKIGYNAIDDGEIPGCYEFDGFVSVLVKAVYDAE